MKNTVKAERKILAVTQSELGGMVQVSRQTINAIERNDNNPSVILSLKLASVFNKHITDIFELEESDWACD